MNVLFLKKVSNIQIQLKIIDRVVQWRVRCVSDGLKWYGFCQDVLYDFDLSSLVCMFAFMLFKQMRNSRWQRLVRVCGFGVIVCYIQYIPTHDYRISTFISFYRLLFFSFVMNFFLRKKFIWVLWFSFPEMWWSHSKHVLSDNFILSMDYYYEPWWNWDKTFFVYCSHSGYYLWRFLWFWAKQISRSVLS